MQPSQQNSDDRVRKTMDEHRPSSIVSPASFRQRVIAAVVCLVITAFFGVFALAARAGTDMGRWLGYCGLKQRTGLPCPTCGMTTATLAFAQGHIGEAFYSQPAWALLCSAMVVAALFAFITAVFAVRFRFIDNFFAKVKLRYIIAALIIILAAGWAVTLSRVLAS